MRVAEGGLRVKVTGGGATVKVTGMATGVALAALTVINALYVPAVREPVLAVAVSELLPIPEGADRLNQAALSLTVQAPLEVMAMVCAAGLAAPCVAV